MNKIISSELHSELVRFFEEYMTGLFEKPYARGILESLKNAQDMDNSLREVIISEIPDYLKIAEGLQELSQMMLDQRGVKRTEKAEELWQSMRGEELAVYSAFLAKTITPLIEDKVAQRAPTGQVGEAIEAVIDEWALPFKVLDSAVDQETIFHDFHAMMDDLKGTIRQSLRTKSVGEEDCTCGADDSPNIGFGDCGCAYHDSLRPQPTSATVPTVEEIETVIGHWRATWDNLHDISKAIHTLLLARMGGAK